MTICTRNPFDCRGGSRLLVGGYSYWPLWFYGQRNELPDVSGHGVTLYPSGAYFDGQGYYFDGSDDYLIDANGRKVLQDGTAGSWHSVYLTEGAIPHKGSAWGTGTILYMNYSGVEPKITGEIILRPEYCPNLQRFSFGDNLVSSLSVDNVKSLKRLFCHMNNLSFLDVSTLPNLEYLYCFDNNLSFLDVSTATSLHYIRAYNNSMDESAVDAVLCALASHSVENGTLQIQDNAPPSSDGEDCKYILVHDLGWSVTTD